MKKLLVLFAVLGFLGAIVFYSPYLGINAEASIECPVCLHVTMVGGSPLSRFLRLVTVFGLLNGVLFATVGFVVLVAASPFRRIIKKARTDDAIVP